MTESTQPPPHYHTLANLARESLMAAMAEAQRMLPHAVMKMHWMAAKRSPAAWRSVEAAYCAQTDCDPQIVNTLTDLALMSEALANLFGVLTERTTTGSLKVAKQKRVEL